jgi:hypothetical protein
VHPLLFVGQKQSHTARISLRRIGNERGGIVPNRVLAWGHELANPIIGDGLVGPAQAPKSAVMPAGDSASESPDSLAGIPGTFPNQVRLRTHNCRS